MALFNLGDQIQTIGVDLLSLGFKGKVHLRDLWNKADLGDFTNEYRVPVSIHGTILLKISE